MTVRKRAEQQGLLHGILLVTLFAFSAFYISEWSWVKHLRLSPLIIGIVIGMGYANSLRQRLPASWNPGVQFCTKKVLRLGIILYGFRLSMQTLSQVGATAFIADIFIVGTVVVLGVLLGRWLKMDKDIALYTAIGSAVCGAAAILGAEPVIKGKPYKATVAVATVVIFGTLSMFLYPLLYRAQLLPFDDNTWGFFTGATVHEVAHVVGAGDTMNNSSIAATAIITKMIRVMLLAPLLLVLSFVLSSKQQGGRHKSILIPWFAVIFLGVIVLNSFLHLPASALQAINSFDTFLLTIAMTALGMETNFKNFKKAGYKPFLLALLLYFYLIIAGGSVVYAITHL